MKSVRRAGAAVGRVAWKGPPSETTDLQADLLAESNPLQSTSRLWMGGRVVTVGGDWAPGQRSAYIYFKGPRSWPVYCSWQQSGTQASPGAEELACILLLATVCLVPRLALEPRSWPVYCSWQQSGTQASPGAEELACILLLATVWHQASPGAEELACILALATVWYPG
ncbi:hypothetical protein Bbelb_113690 [Branchiostoma belcheri]|nr:hypothetical protein Bbelb_113690 [Branchiostoma belcheri]